MLLYVKYKLMDLNCRPLMEIPICEIIVGPGLKQNKVVDSVKYFLEKTKWDIWRIRLKLLIYCISKLKIC